MHACCRFNREIGLGNPDVSYAESGEIIKSQKVSDIMTKVVVTARPDTRLTGIIKLMLKHNVGAMPVVDTQ